MAAPQLATSGYIADPVIGFNLTGVDLPISSSSISGTAGLFVPQLGPQCQPGQKFKTNAGVVIYGCAGVTIATSDLVYFDYDSTYGEFTAKEATTAATTTTQLAGGVALAAMTAGQFGWFFAGEGYCNVSVAASITALTALTTTISGGVMGSGGTAVPGAFNVTTTTGAAIVLCKFTRGINFN